MSPTTRANAKRATLAVVVAFLWVTAAALPARSDDPSVRAVLFYSPTCPHCHQVMTQDLPPIMDRFDGRLQVLLVDVSVPAGETLYERAVATFGVTPDRLGVPTLIVGDVVLVGSREIPEQLPSLAERLLAAGGSDWPAIPGLADALPPGQPTATAAPAAAGEAPATTPSAPPAAAAGSTVAPGSPVATALERAGRDPLGSTLAIAVLIGLLLSLGWVAAAAWRARGRIGPGVPRGWIAAVAMAGLAVAGYLSFVELAGSAAVCGPVGDCNLVHASSYARVLGVPLGLLGAAGYAAILGCWFVARRARQARATAARYGLVGLAAAGTLFSAYLTFLEPFVIGASCAWCLASALLMDATLLLGAASAWPGRARTRSAARAGAA
jgi:uncharacterized membrane protein